MEEISAFEIRKYLALEEVLKTKDLKNIKINNFRIHRGINYLTKEETYEYNLGIDMFGTEEYHYLENKTKDEREKKLRQFLDCKPKLIILVNNIILDELIEIIKLDNIECAVFRSNLGFQEVYRVLKKVFRKKTQEETLIDKTLFMEIFGMGVLIQGDKDIRSSLALELLKKKHGFISNNDVKIIKYSGIDIFGRNKINDYEKYILKMSNGVKFDILKNLGTSLGRRSKRVDMLLILENWSPKKRFDRLGLDETFEKILDIDIPKIVIPIKKGRSLSVIVEAVSLNHRLKCLGEHSSAIFFEKTKKLIGRNKMISQNKNNDKLHYIENFDKQSKINKICGAKSGFYLESSELYYPIFTSSETFCLENRFHILDKIVLNQLANLSKVERKDILDEYFNTEIQGILIEKDTILKDEIKIYCELKNINLYENINDFSITLDIIEEILELEFSPKTTLHGVLMEIYGLGVLITGKSGVGKSETALELVTRGHRLIADDRVEVALSPDKILNGYCGEIPYFMELRGMGIINVRSLYGIGAIKESKSINIVVEIVEDENNEFIEEQIVTENILGKEITKKIIYINTGRNTATLVEAVALDQKSKRLEIGGKF